MKKYYVVLIAVFVLVFSPVVYAQQVMGGGVNDLSNNEIMNKNRSSDLQGKFTDFENSINQQKTAIEAAEADNAANLANARGRINGYESRLNQVESRMNAMRSQISAGGRTMSLIEAKLKQMEISLGL